MSVGAVPLGTRVRRIADRRQVLRRLVATDLKVKYEGATLGYLWSVLEPLLLTGVYFFVFSFIGRFGVPNYGLFLIAGILPWHWLLQTVNASTNAVWGNAKLIKKVYLPREVFPLSLVVSKTFEFLLSLLVLVVFAAILRVGPSIYLAAMPLAILIQLVMLTGLALGLSAGAVLLQDIDRVIRPILRSIFYLSPILYPVAKVLRGDFPVFVKVLYRINPFVGLLDLYHAVWYPEGFPGWGNVGVSAGAAVLFLLIGWRVFTRLEPKVLKEL